MIGLLSRMSIPALVSEYFITHERVYYGRCAAELSGGSAAQDRKVEIETLLARRVPATLRDSAELVRFMRHKLTHHQTTGAEIFPKGGAKIHHDLLGRVYLQVDSAAIIEHQERQERQREAILKDAGFVAEPAPNAESAAPSASNGDAGEAAEEKDSFDVVLTAFGDKKINVIKEVRAITELGLKEAKDLVEGAPNLVMRNCTKTQAKDLEAKLASAGATVELRPAMH